MNFVVQNHNGFRVYEWSIYKWNVTPSEKLTVKNKNGGDIAINSSTNEITDSIDNIALYLIESDTTISQSVADLERDKEYTLSGYIKSDTGSKVTVWFHPSHEKKYTTLDNVDNSNEIINNKLLIMVAIVKSLL